jgi:hypothetical protein
LLFVLFVHSSISLLASGNFAEILRLGLGKFLMLDTFHRMTSVALQRLVEDAKGFEVLLSLCRNLEQAGDKIRLTHRITSG